MTSGTGSIIEAALPLAIPSALQAEQTKIAQSFKDEQIDIDVVGVFVTKSSGPVPANFWIELAHHAAKFPLDHFVDELEVALGAAILRAYEKVRQWSKRDVRANLRLPGKQRAIQYIIPETTVALAAIKALKKHYKSLDESHANEYFWVEGDWVSAEQYFARKRS